MFEKGSAFVLGDRDYVVCVLLLSINSITKTKAAIFLMQIRFFLFSFSEELALNIFLVNALIYTETVTSIMYPTCIVLLHFCK